jgi:hypothetical protein
MTTHNRRLIYPFLLSIPQMLRQHRFASCNSHRSLLFTFPSFLQHQRPQLLEHVVRQACSSYNESINQSIGQLHTYMHQRVSGESGIDPSLCVRRISINNIRTYLSPPPSPARPPAHPVARAPSPPAASSSCRCCRCCRGCRGCPCPPGSTCWCWCICVNSPCEDQSTSINAGSPPSRPIAHAHTSTMPAGARGGG